MATIHTVYAALKKKTKQKSFFFCMQNNVNFIKRRRDFKSDDFGLLKWNVSMVL